MKDEKAKIRACKDGMGHYTFEHNDHRAKHFASAFDTMMDPDSVFECDNLKSAKYSFVKEYDSKPYPFTVFLVTVYGSLFVPTTSFPCRRKDIKKWQAGKVFYTRNTEAAP